MFRNCPRIFTNLQLCPSPLALFSYKHNKNILRKFQLSIYNYSHRSTLCKHKQYPVVNPLFIFQSNSEMSSTAIAEDQQNSLDRPSRLAIEIFTTAVESVKPSNLLKQRLLIQDGSILKIKDETDFSINLAEFERIFVVGFGKAVLPMAEEIKNILGDRVERCIVNIPEGFRDSTDDEIEIHRGARNNIPDESAYRGSKKIVQLVQDCKPNDLLIVLISGGGSALFSYPLFPVTISEMSSVVKNLSRSGASIQELNSVRKRLSLVKGGGLLSLSQSSKIISLILSDVMGDPLDVIASGPTVPNPDPESMAKEIIEKYMSFDSLPQSVKEVLNNPVLSPSSKDVTNVIIGNNSIALDTAATTAQSLNLYPIIVTNKLSGEASDVGSQLGDATQAISFLIQSKKTDNFNVEAYSNVIYRVGEKLELDKSRISEILETLLNENIQKDYDGVCLLFGGETTVTVKGKGVGGRNQELALNAGIKIDSFANDKHVKGKVAVLSAGTDGFDGPCDAAGAVVDSTTVQKGYVDKLSPHLHCIDNNSYNYFRINSNGKYHILLGHTETNVMDLIVIVVLK